MTKMAREAGKLWGWVVVVSIFEMDQNREQLIFQKNFPIFLLSGNSNTSVLKVCSVLC